MQSYQLPALPHTVHGRGEALKQELVQLVNHAELFPTAAADLADWFAAAATAVQAKLDAAAGVV